MVNSNVESCHIIIVTQALEIQYTKKTEYRMMNHYCSCHLNLKFQIELPKPVPQQLPPLTREWKNGGTNRKRTTNMAKLLCHTAALDVRQSLD